ncbi:hypothetical protein [Thermosporothrix hazakensis]|nr:hypothetical protein [Thermosporothrix hazakensis]
MRATIPEQQRYHPDQRKWCSPTSRKAIEQETAQGIEAIITPAPPP